MSSPRPSGWLPPEQFVPTLSHGIAYASLLFTDTEGRLLGLRSALDPTELHFPGGLLDPGEDLFACACRETVEELGFLPAAVDRGQPRLLVMSFTSPEPPWPWKVGAVFDGGTLDAEDIGRITLDPAEHSSYAFKPVQDWIAAVSPRRARVLNATVTARATGGAVYLGPFEETRALRAAVEP
ncbi:MULTISPECIES: NUDIX domain-containing protein [unclassified Kitasatospora]|uniref:NUDIX domain-containing protein n=1 Tax=unclassified Kitasatospora TaxID=2633591 RepID=UPI00070B31A5|nr:MULTISPECIES: NUDIX hydrolase [unclassified Kitasatospora]KQV10937.1 hypothetical protein ASC99_36195 [Kitasatospora sp. Root107]KRB72629.1 hypothetical protein ASE03_22645 [Kitasatospora sp. Root187]